MERRKNYRGRVEDTTLIEANSTIFKGVCKIYDVTLTSGGDASTLTIYDGVDTTGEKKYKVSSIADHSKGIHMLVPIKFNIGVHCVLTGTAPVGIIGYEIIPKSVEQ